MDIGSIFGTSPAVPQTPAVDMPAAAQPTLVNPPAASSLLTPSAMPGAVPVTPQVTHRRFGDSIGTRKAIYDSVLNAARAFAPATNNQYTLGLQNVDYDGRDNFTKAEQKKAILSGATLGRSLRGDWVLTDPTGAEVSRKRALLARVPHMTERGTFIVNGSEYSLAHQMRLRPGIYTRQQENGEIEAHVNVKSGRAHKLFLDPATGIFRIKIGQARIPLVPLLKTMGVTDKQLRESWGDLAAVNQQKSDPQALKKLYERVRSTGTDTDPEAQAKSVAEAFLQMELDPDVTKRTLGQAFTRVGPDSILATTRKLLAVSRGEQEPDDRDSMAYQSLMGPEDLFAERITKAKNIARNLLWKSTARRGIDHIPAGVLTNALQSTLTMSGLGQALEEINTAEILDHQSRVTRRGEGGIQDASAIPMECHSADTEVFTSEGWVPWPEVSITTKFACKVNDRLEFHTASRLFCGEYVGRMYGLQTRTISYLVTPNHRMWCRKYRGGSSVRRCGFAPWGFASAAEVHRRAREFEITHLPAAGRNPRIFTVPRVDGARVQYAFDFNDWAELVGWYVAEGSINRYMLRVESKYQITLLQGPVTHPDRVERLSALLTRMGISFSFHERRFIFTSKQLGRWFEQCGIGELNKRLPEECFTWSVEARRRLLEAACLGNGSQKLNGVRTYCSASVQLMRDISRLMLSLGTATREHTSTRRGSNEHLGRTITTRNDTHTCRELLSQYQGATTTPAYDNYFIQEYAGNVYCAEVPGGLLLTRRNKHVGLWLGNSRSVNPSQLGLIDYLRTPESLSAGIDVRLARNAMKGSDGRLYTKVINANSGLTETRSANDIADGTLAFSGELQSGKLYVNVLQNGKIRTVPRENVDFELPDTESSFSPLGNLIPFKSSVKGQRSVMGSRFLTQALPLENAEAPYVQSGIPGQVDRSFEQEYGTHMGALRSPQGGVVTKVTPDAVEVRYEDGTKETHELYVNSPLNRKSVVGSTKVYIKRGDALLRTRIDHYAWQDGDVTLSIDPATKKSAWLPVTGYTKHENDKQLLQIRLSSGRSVVVTEDHSLMVMGEAGHLVPAFPQDLKIDRTRLPVAMLPLEASQSMPKDLGVLIGLYLSEGHCPPSQPGLIMLSVKPPDRIAEILVLLQRMGHTPQPKHSGGCVNFTSHEVCEFLVENFGHLSGNKRIPDWVFQTTSEFRWSVLSGYMAGDGNIWADHNGSLQVTGVSTSVALRDGLVELAATLGIFCTIFDAPRQYLNANWNDAYGFRLTSQDLLLSLTDIPLFFYSDREAKFRAILKPQYRPSTFTAVPVANTRSARKLLYAGFSHATAYVHKVAAAKGAVTSSKLATSTNVFGKWGRSDVRWDKVVAIEPVPHQDWVYDLSVADSECFAVDHGLIVHNTFIHQTPTVRPGQTFKQGDLLARSNYTDHEGTTALGMNARVAYLPDEGYNYEDAISISESFSKRMRSQHAYQHQHEWEPGDHQGKKAFISMFPSQYTKKQLDKFDDSGVVKQGETLHFGDPMILIAAERERNKKSLVRSRTSFSDKSITWEHHSPGIVTDVVQTAKGPAVVVKSYASMQAADKLAGRVGDKGIISRIIPDDQMPVGEDGKPMEVLLNPLGLTSRTNPMQMIEAALGKIAAKTGKPFRMPDFQNSQDLVEMALAKLKEHNMSDTETVTLADGRKVKGVPVGNRWFMKLHHMADDKIQGRGLGAYDAEGAPQKGGQEGGKSKRVGMLEQNALLSHGALAVMNEDMRIKGQSSPEYWARYMSGYKPETPKVPFVYNKFVNQLRASGINVVRQGERSHIMAMTNKSVDELVGDRELQNAETVNWKNMEPMKGGLFDPTLTGGHGGTSGGGNKWSFIRLHQPLPNPVMEEPIRHILGLTQKKLQDVIGGKEQLNGKTGAAAIGAALEAINLPRALENARADIKSGKKTLRDKAVRRLGYLKTCERLGTHPKDWMLDKVPVLPPAFRPVSVMGAKKLPLVADPNYLYKDLFQLNQMHKELAKHLDPDALGDEQSAVYNAFKAVTGLGDPVGVKNQERGVKGILASVFGSSPKYGVMNRKLLSSTVDMVGRGVIAPDPNLTLDETGIPETAAWDVFGPAVVRRMVRAGVSRQKAVQSVKDQLPAAKQYLQKEMDEGVVILSRAPTLHRYGTMAFRPKLIKGSAIKMNPLVNKGFGADYDGDQMNFRALTTDEAKQEALQKMLPSVNLFSTANFKADMNVPSQEYVAGLYQASKNSDTETPPAVFATAADAIRAFRSGKLGFDRRIQILES